MVYGTEISQGLVSRITDKILPEVNEWQNRPLEAIYSVVFFDGIVFNSRKDNKIVTKCVYSVLGINMEGQKEILGTWISEKLGKENIFLVGGFVRDKLRNKESKDIDFAVSLDPETVKRAFPYGYASPFGTVSFKLNSFSITLASRRKENGYQDYRHPGNLIFVNTIEEDFKRRDFTINSLYANHM